VGIAGQERVTRFEYDTLGRQTATVSPTVGIYSSAGDSQLGNGSAVTVTETQTQVRSETSYDVFGNAFRNRLVTTADAGVSTNGTFTYKAYDNLGRIKYEVDALKQVTSYTYDSFGNRTVVTRHAAPLSSAPWYAPTTTSVTMADVAANLTANAATDRTIDTTFDRLGRQLQVKQPSAEHVLSSVGGPNGPAVTLRPTTEYGYNAFGDVVMVREMTSSSTWATSYAYYDHRGLKTATLDASRFLTQLFYDETGDLTRQIEYARPTTGTADLTTFGTMVTSANGTAQGDDRETRFTYDTLNRKLTETKFNIEYSYLDSNQALQTSFTGAQTTTYGYDVLGNQTMVRVTNPVDGSNIDSYTWYDVLGRAVATAVPRRDVGNGTF